jgi:hypothetical protein
MGAVVADFRELMEIFSKKSNTEELGLIATISRNLWKRRNTVLYGGLLTHSNRLAYEARESLENFFEANVKEGQSNEAQSAVGDDLEV